MRPRIVAITGGIGSGKSQALEIFRSLGYPCYNADDYSRGLYQGWVLDELEEIFPGLIKDGQLDRALLRERVLAREEDRLALNRLTHPIIMERLHEDISQGAGDELSVVEVPLLSEVMDIIEEDFDLVLVIYVQASLETRIGRLVAREGFSEEQALRLIQGQPYDRANRDLADVILTNDGSRQDLAWQIKNLLEVDG